MAQQTGHCLTQRQAAQRPDYGQPGPDMQDWHYRWAVEALRAYSSQADIYQFRRLAHAHRLACAIEDAGFEIRDQIEWWIYGLGFPKSLDVSKAIDKAAGAEREVGNSGMARGYSETSPTNDGRNQAGYGLK